MNRNENVQHLPVPLEQPRSGDLGQGNTTALPATRGRKAGADPDAKAMMEAIAWDVGKELVAYIEVMYPKAIEATSSTFTLSMRNHIHNDIMAAFEFRGDAIALATRLKDRKEFRRQWVAAYRKIRAQPR